MHKYIQKNVILSCLAVFPLSLTLLEVPEAAGQTAPQAAAPTASSFQGSVVKGEVSPEPVGLSLDDAMQRGLTANLGIILSGNQADTARAQRLSQLQSLLPGVDFAAKETVAQVDLPAQGLRLPNFPTIIGPFGYTDVRASLSWSVVDVPSLRNYMSARHNFAAAGLTAQDARDLVVLTVGNAYFLVLADQTAVESAQAQVDTSQVSLNQAVANHEAGTAPKLDELRARVDYQQQEQYLISAQTSLAKDKLALARTIGLPLEQKFTLTDQAPYSAFDEVDVNALIAQAQANRKDLGGTGAAGDGRRRSTQSSNRRTAAHFQGHCGLRRHRHHAQPLARHGGCIGNGEFSSVQRVWAARRRRSRRRRNSIRHRRSLSDKKSPDRRRCARRAAGYSGGAEAG